jgi:hypothetical protein
MLLYISFWSRLLAVAVDRQVVYVRDSVFLHREMGNLYWSKNENQSHISVIRQDRAVSKKKQKHTAAGIR